MKEDSAFFTNPLTTNGLGHSGLELIHSSEVGWSELYRVDKEGRFRVLKALKSEYRGDERYERQLRKEFEIGYSLNHPGICEVYSFSTHPQLGNCIEMEWVDGQNLSDYLKSEKPTPAKALDIVSQICDALSYIHAKQVVHRDIKPSNIMLTYNGGNVKLIDFGLADSDSHSFSKTPAGTISFAAPELLSGSAVDNRADIYSLGVVISLLSPRFRSVAARCTKTKPARRYGSALDVVYAMKRKLSAGYCLRTIFFVALIALLCYVAYLFFAKRTVVSHDIPLEEELQQTDSLQEPTVPVPTPKRTPATKTQEAREDTAPAVVDVEDIDKLFDDATDALMLKD